MAIFDKILHAFNDTVVFVRTNAWTMFLLLVGLYVLRQQLQNVAFHLSGQRLHRASTKNKSREEDMRLARLRQQEQLNQLAKERPPKPSSETATTDDKATDEKKKNKKKTPAQQKPKPDSGYNPMQPWSASSGGYRPARRTVRRG